MRPTFYANIIAVTYGATEVSQEPIAPFRCIFDRLKLKPSHWIYDPFMGVGASRVAAVEAGLNFVGSEVEPMLDALQKGEPLFAHMKQIKTFTRAVARV